MMTIHDTFVDRLGGSVIAARKAAALAIAGNHDQVAGVRYTSGP